jgi:hypothetical protein
LKFLLFACIAALLTTSTLAVNDEAVVVSALRDPVDKSYRRMMKGRELFEALHALAPAAALRYKLLPRKRETKMDGIGLAVVGDSFELAVPVAADRTFALERDQRALDEDASVRPNRRARTMTWRSEVRTPGLPADTRRLGDLRLECRVGMEARLVSEDASFIGRVMEFIQSGAEFCNAPEDVPYLFFAERPLFSVTLSAGARRQTVSIGRLYAGVAHGRTPKEELPYCDCEALLDRAYTLPLGDRSWPDDTLVEFEHMDLPASQAEHFLRGDNREGVSAVFGKGTVTRFDSGYEVWSYRYGPRERRFGETEFVVLFDPSGAVAKTRLRPAPAQ